jgi:hypothetical protein
MGRNSVEATNAFLMRAVRAVRAARLGGVLCLFRVAEVFALLLWPVAAAVLLFKAGVFVVEVPVCVELPVVA